MDIRDTPLYKANYKHVKSLKGNQFLVELTKAREGTYFNMGAQTIAGAFDWEDTPQRYEFWHNIAQEIWRSNRKDRYL